MSGTYIIPPYRAEFFDVTAVEFGYTVLTAYARQMGVAMPTALGYLKPIEIANECFEANVLVARELISAQTASLVRRDQE